MKYLPNLLKIACFVLVVSVFASCEVDNDEFLNEVLQASVAADSTEVENDELLKDDEQEVVEEDSTESDKDATINEDEPEVVEEDATCSDDNIKIYFSKCIWFMNSDTHDFLDDLKMDFSNENIHVYDENDTVVDEGYWTIKDGVLTFHNLSMTLANYVGEWTINECRADFLSISRGNETLQLEKDCE